jgi:UDP-N-acetylglucosamine--N-acetylmuramyl-(pentapeptide) pyrophosphoryl-undecaprenol N-acetylglucosamine transferase
LVFGGSLGARTLNEAMASNLETIKSQANVQFIWQIGKLYWNEYKNSDTAELPNVKALPYIDRMEYAYSAADIIVARAGALSISELAIVGKPAILVPSPNVAEDHQTKNANALEEKGAAVMIKDYALKEVLFKEINNLLTNEALALKMKNKILEFAKPNAAKQIAQEIIVLANEK